MALMFALFYFVSVRPLLSSTWWDVCQEPLELLGYFAVPAGEREEAVREGMNAAEEGAMWHPVKAPREPYGIGHIPFYPFIKEVAQTFEVDKPIRAVAPHTPTWFTTGSGCTVEVYRLEGERWKLVAKERFEDVKDNSWPSVEFPLQPPGIYKWVIVEPRGKIGVWARWGDSYPGGHPFVNGKPVEGFDFETRVITADGGIKEIFSSDALHFSLPLGWGMIEDWEKLKVRIGFAVGSWNNGHFPYYPEWFFRRFPDCAMLDQEGKPFMAGMFGKTCPWVSICHPAIVEGTRRYIRSVVRALRDCDAVAYWIMGGESLYPTYSFPGRWADYGENAILHFRAWLRERYGDLDRLNAAWGTSFRSFDEVEPPRHPKRDLPSLDWHRFRLHAMAERFRWHYAAIRAEDPKRLILTCNHGDLRRRVELGADPALYASVSDGFETGQIIVGNDPILFNLLYFRILSSFGKPICPARLAFKSPDPRARGGGRSFTPEAARRYVYECLGCGAWHVGLVQWSGSLPDGEWGIKGTPAQAEVRRIFSEIREIRPWLDCSWPVKPNVAFYLSGATWTLYGFRPTWLEIHRELVWRHIPADFIYDMQLARGDVRDYEVLVSLDNPIVPDGTLRGIVDFLRDGGTLLVSGEFAELDENLKPRRKVELPGEVVRPGSDLLHKISRFRPLRLNVEPEEKPVLLEDFRTVGWRERNLADDMSGKHSLGQTVRIPAPARSILISTPTYLKTCDKFGFILRVRLDGPGGSIVAEKRVSPPIGDNAWHELKIPRRDPAGTIYYVEVVPDPGLPPTTLGWWGRKDDIYPGGTAFVDGKPVPYDREVILKIEKPLPDIAAVESFLLSDGMNPAVVLINVTDGDVKVEGELDESLLSDGPEGYRSVELLSGSGVGDGQRFKIILPPRGKAVVLFKRRTKEAEVEMNLKRLEPCLLRLEKEGFLTPVMRALRRRAMGHLQEGRFSKAMALLKLLSGQIGVKVERSSWEPGKGLDLVILLKGLNGEPVERADVRAELVPLYGLKPQFSSLGDGRYALFLPAGKVPKAYDYETRRYVPYSGPVEALIEAKARGMRGSLRVCLSP